MLSNTSSASAVPGPHDPSPPSRPGRRLGKLLLLTGLCLAQLVCVHSAAEAWGKKAHRIVAGVAESLLDDQTTRAVHDLVGPGGLVAVASWADELRDARPETAPWHYVNIPLEDAKYDAEKHCSSPTVGACVVAVIERFAQEMADPTLSRADRAEALKFVTHFVADIHQPLHCMAEARGGNDIPVELLGQRDHPVSGRPWNLHAVWDGGLIHLSGLTERAYRKRVLELLRVEPAEPRHLGTPADWANESHRLAADVALKLPRSGRIGPRYGRIATRVIDRQLGLAGFRLARLLEAALGRS